MQTTEESIMTGGTMGTTIKQGVVTLLVVDLMRRCVASFRRTTEAEERDRFVEEYNAAYAELRADPEAWAEEQCEREAWESTLCDGVGSA
jgi:hypothetical protein